MWGLWEEMAVALYMAMELEQREAIYIGYCGYDASLVPAAILLLSIWKTAASVQMHSKTRLASFIVPLLTKDRRSGCLPA